MEWITNVNATVPKYAMTFPFEDNYNYFDAKEMMEKFWNQAHYWVAAYLGIVFGLRELMKTRRLVSFQLFTLNFFVS